MPCWVKFSPRTRTSPAKRKRPRRSCSALRFLSWSWVLVLTSESCVLASTALAEAWSASRCASVADCCACVAEACACSAVLCTLCAEALDCWEASSNCCSCDFNCSICWRCCCICCCCAANASRNSCASRALTAEFGLAALTRGLYAVCAVVALAVTSNSTLNHTKDLIFFLLDVFSLLSWQLSLKHRPNTALSLLHSKSII